MWGDNATKKRTKATKSKKKKDRERELSTSSFTSADLSNAIQGEFFFSFLTWVGGGGREGGTRRLGG